MSRATTARATPGWGRAALPVPHFESRGEVVLLAVCLGIAGLLLVQAVLRWNLLDVDAYWDAAVRLRSGQPLYPVFENVDAWEVYRYAPWFAYTWVPLTLLPRWLVDSAWSAVLVATSVVAVWHLLVSRRAPAVAAGAVMLAMLVLAACYGNVQPILIAGLVRTVDRRTGPVWIGVAASLKFVPLLYVLVYLGRREWLRAATAVGVTAALLAPMLLFDLSGYTTDPGESLISLYNLSPIAWGVAAAAGLVTAVVACLRRSPLAWLAASVAMILVLPRTHLNYLSYLVVGTHTDAAAASATEAERA